MRRNKSTQFGTGVGIEFYHYNELKIMKDQSLGFSILGRFIEGTAGLLNEYSDKYHEKPSFGYQQ
jgi:hypothetical protein